MLEVSIATLLMDPMGVLVRILRCMGYPGGVGWGSWSVPVSFSCCHGINHGILSSSAYHQPCDLDVFCLSPEQVTQESGQGVVGFMIRI